MPTEYKQYKATDPESTAPDMGDPNEPVKLCKNCRYFKLSEEGGWLSTCLNVESTVDLVMGGPTHAYCNTERQYGSCGIEGKFWTPKETTHEPLPEKPF